MRRVVVGVACAILLVGCGGPDRSPESSKSAQPIDGMFDVGGRKMYLSCDGSGGPTVILEAGLDGNHKTWDKVLPEVASTSRVCAYDRANIDPSEPAPPPRTARHMVDDLHALLEAGKVKPPYVLVGFSFGGLVSQLDASTHPDDIVGLVLVESNHPDEVEQFEAELTPAQIKADRQAANANEEGVDIFASFEQVQAAPGAFRGTDPLVGRHRREAEDWPTWVGYAEVFNRLRAAEQKPSGRPRLGRTAGHREQEADTKFPRSTCNHRDGDRAARRRSADGRIALSRSARPTPRSSGRRRLTPASGVGLAASLEINIAVTVGPGDLGQGSSSVTSGSILSASRDPLGGVQSARCRSAASRSASSRASSASASCRGRGCLSPLSLH